MDEESQTYSEYKRKLERAKSLLQSDSDVSFDSEKSYEPLFSKSEMYEFFTYLSFNAVWIFVSACANALLYTIYTYDILFRKSSSISLSIYPIVILCLLILTADILACVCHRVFKEYAAIKSLKPRSKQLMLLDILSLFWFPISLTPSLNQYKYLQIISILFSVIRLYRVILYFIAVSNNPGFDSLGIIYKKYGLIFFLVGHSGAFIFMSLTCYKCESVENWTESIDDRIFEDRTIRPIEWYLMCAFLVFGSMTSFGTGDVHAITNLEIFYISIIMLIGFILLEGTFLGAWTSTQMENYRRQANFSHRLTIISSSLKRNGISDQLKDKVNKFYQNCWKEMSGVQYSELFLNLPVTFKEQTYLDMYWTALKSTYLLKDLDSAFLRAIASVMTTEIYVTGESLYEDGKNKAGMIYILKGSVQIMSVLDGESPILTLGIGTCIGEANLIYNISSRVNVKASSYCMVQCLQKSDFWKVAYAYRKLINIEVIHDKINDKLDNAKNMILMKRHAKEQTKEKHFGSSMIIKHRLKSEQTKSEIIHKRENVFKEKNQHRLSEYTDLYILSLRQTILRHSDEIFLHTSWPWILQPNSVFLRVWEFFICTVILIICLVYPYQVSFLRLLKSWTTFIDYSVGIVFTFDIVLQLFTATERDRRLVTQLSEIAVLRFQSISFICDVIAGFPIVPLAEIFDMIEANSRITAILSMHHLFKTYRLLLLFNSLEASFNLRTAIIRCIKYCIYFLLTTYFVACILYMMACFSQTCIKNSWFDQIQNEDLKTDSKRYIDYIPLSLFYGGLIVSMVGYGNMAPLTIREICASMIFSLICTVTFCYLVADYTATLMLTERPRLTFVETVSVIKKYFVSNKMLQNNQARTDVYLELQWKMNSGYYIRKENLMYDIPPYINQQIQSAKYLTAIQNIPLFGELNKEILEIVALGCKQVLLPPNEIVVYAGEVIRCLYFIDDGYCEMISAASGKKEHILGPKSHFCDFDMILEQPGIHYIRTLTHVRVIKIDYSHVKSTFSKFNLTEQLENLVQETKNTFAVQRLFMRSGKVVYHHLREDIEQSWFIFPRRKLHPLNKDYEKGFDSTGILKYSREVLMRRTVMPNGKFLLYWEITQAIRVFFIGFYYLVIPVIEAYVINLYATWFCYSIVVFIDMYIRLHICYYNENGILISHPGYTAYHYLTTTFLTDLISLLPLASVVRAVFGFRNQSVSTVVSLIEQATRLNVLLPMYRIYGVFAYFESDILKTQSPIMAIIKFIPIILLVFNAFANILVTITCETRQDQFGYTVLVPNEDSWIIHLQPKLNFNATQPINMYLASFFWISTSGLSLGNASFKAYKVSEMLLIFITILFGYFLFTYMFIVTVSNKASIDINLTLYHEKLKHLRTYMNREKLNRDLQKRVFSYFEHMWQRTHGMKAHVILSKCHQALHQDCLLYLYEDTFKEVQIFEDTSTLFFRRLGHYVEEKYFLKDTIILKLNDIVNNFYIMHRGEAKVLGPDGSLFAFLQKGCVFGNIDNTVHSRSTITVVTTSPVDILCVKTTLFYTLAADFPFILTRLKNIIVLQNRPYIEKKQPKLGSIDRRTFRRWTLDLTKHEIVKHIVFLGSLTLPMMLSSYISVWLTLYHLAFQNHSFLILFLVYIFDIFHIVRIFAEFHLSYYNEIGELVTDSDLIRKRYLTPMRFYRELVALLPLDIFAFFAQENSALFVLSCLRINRMLRFWNVYQFFNVTYEQLHINVSTVKIGTFVTYFSLALHIQTCILYMATCPRAICLDSSWISAGDSSHKNHYLVTTYFIILVITRNGFGIYEPKTIPEMLILIFLILIGKFVTSLLMGDISALVHYYSYTLVRYSYQMDTLKKYLENNYIDRPLINRVLNYVKNLWYTDRGNQFPLLLREAPSYLIEEVKSAVYGKHLYDNYIFTTCHDDFLRLLIAKMRVETYFQGDIICQQGDINDTMYFIHSGIINVFTVTSVEEFTRQLEVGDCFGLIQGLYGYTPHTYTYRAATKTIIVSLNLRKWCYLLFYYRAARFEIYTKARQLVDKKVSLNDLRNSILKSL